MLRLGLGTKKKTLLIRMKETVFWLQISPKISNLSPKNMDGNCCKIVSLRISSGVVFTSVETPADKHAMRTWCVLWKCHYIAFDRYKLEKQPLTLHPGVWAAAGPWFSMHAARCFMSCCFYSAWNLWRMQMRLKMVFFWSRPHART